jgi:hypothetical protein
VSDGISAERAEELAAQLNEDARKRPKYFASAWIPREHLLSLLARPFRYRQDLFADQ